MSKKITPEMLAASDTEDGHQLALMCWCADNFEKYPELKRLIHIPNGGSRNKAEAAKLKAMGVKSGFPDLFLPLHRDGWSGLMIELKKPKGGIESNEQQEWIKFLRNENYNAHFCYGWEQARDMLITYLES